MIGTAMAASFRPLGRALARVAAPHFRARGFAEARVLTQWETIVGEALARQSAPERLGPDGTLRLRVAGGAATEIQHLEPQILERIASHFGYRAVKRLALIQGPLPRPRPAPEAPSLSPLSAAEERGLEAALRPVDREPLRHALAALGRAVLGRAERGRE